MAIWSQYEKLRIKKHLYFFSKEKRKKKKGCVIQLDITLHFSLLDVPAEDTKHQSHLSVTGLKKWMNYSSSSYLKCFAHASARACLNNILIHGGFGETSEGKHSRLNSVRLLDLNNGELVTAQPSQENTVGEC